jgi:hypothetical protein
VILYLIESTFIGDYLEGLIHYKFGSGWKGEGYLATSVCTLGDCLNNLRE